MFQQMRGDDDVDGSIRQLRLVEIADHQPRQLPAHCGAAASYRAVRLALTVRSVRSG
jgi:hypothetical protein